MLFINIKIALALNNSTVRYGKFSLVNFTALTLTCGRTATVIKIFLNQKKKKKRSFIVSNMHL
jgi:hypothetical protein